MILEPANLPEQKTGASTETIESKEYASTEAAIEIYRQVKERLLSVNRWQEFAGAGTAGFQLMDKNGKELRGMAADGNYFKIDIPGPGSGEGDGYDWIQVEEIMEQHEENINITSMRVRPSENPQSNADHATAHFFTHEATSNFVAGRNGRLVWAAVYGRNEKPNITESESLVDKARNAAVGTGALIGLSKIQWKSLVQGLMDL